MINTNSCLVKSAVKTHDGNFNTLEIPAEKLKTEEANRLLISWSYDNWLYYDRKAAREFVSGNLNQAVMLWCKAFMELENVDIDDPRLLSTLENLVDGHLALREIAVAAEFAERNLVLNKLVFDVDSVQAMNCHKKLGQIYYNLQRYGDACRAIEESERIAKKLGNKQTSMNKALPLRFENAFAPPASTLTPP